MRLAFRFFNQIYTPGIDSKMISNPSTQHKMAALDRQGYPAFFEREPNYLASFSALVGVAGTAEAGLASFFLASVIAEVAGTAEQA